MDRWYDADLREYDIDKHHIWMSFASEDRNKVDEETTLILKKSGTTPTNTSGFVATTPRHKILAIENEAPDFIKTTYEVMGEWVATDATQGGTIGNFYEDSPIFGVPYIGFKEIRIPKEQWETSTFSSLQNKDNSILSGSILDRGSSLVVRLIEQTPNPSVGTWFNISNISYHASSTATKQHYVISIDDFFDSAGVEKFVGSATNPLDIIASLSVEIAKKTIESRPEFDGRFFVKVERSDELIHNLGGLNTQITTNSVWMNTQVSFDALFLYGATYNRSSYDNSSLQTTAYDNSIYPGWEIHSQGTINNTWTSMNRLLTYNIGVNGCGSIQNGWVFPDADVGSGMSAGWGNGRTITNVANPLGDICDQWDFSPPFRVKQHWNELYDQYGEAGTQGFWFIDSEPAIGGSHAFHSILVSGSYGSNTSKWAFRMASHGKGADIGNHEITISLTGCNGVYNGTQFNIPPPQQLVYDALTTPGSKFKFNDDPDKIIYEISSATINQVYNYKSTNVATSGEDEVQRIRIHLELIEPGTAGNPVNKAIGQPADAVFLTGSTSFALAYSPSNYIDIDPTYVPATSPVTGVNTAAQASETNGIRISFVELQTNSSSSTTETSFASDPAVWETEPKENVGLDIYYEIGQAYPVNMCDGTEELYIQPGATVSMYQSNTSGTYTLSGWRDANTVVNGTLQTTTYAPPSTPPFPTTMLTSTHVSATTGSTSFTHDVWLLVLPNTVSSVAGFWVCDTLIVNGPLNINIIPGLGISDLGSNIPPLTTVSTVTTFPPPWQLPTQSMQITISNPIVLGPDIGPGSWNAFTSPNNPFPTGGSMVTFTSGGFITSATVTSAGVASITGCAGDIPFGSTQPSTLVEFNNGQVLNSGDILSFTNPDGTIVTATVAFDSLTNSSATMVGPTYVPQNQIYLNALVHGERQTLPYYNCYTYGNGVESNRIRDLFNAVTIDKGVKASTTLAEQYKEEHRKSGLIFSGIYNSMNGVNRLNQFIMAENITKDLNPEYGSIQKLHTRDADLITLCEDKVLKVLSNKDALYNADDTKNITATHNVLGNSIPFVGEYGISKNPESFASEAFRAYFTDRERGAVLRLSRDGLTPISDHGMKDWFADNLSTTPTLIGSYDRRRSLYNISGPLGAPFVVGQTSSGPTYDTLHQTISFSEKSRGWVSFKTINPEDALSLNNEYYTAMRGRLWKHHDNSVDRNSFYDTSGAITNSSSITVLFNDLPSVVKSFTTLNYEGSQSNVVQNLAGFVYNTSMGPIASTDNKYYNNQPKLGWYVNSITTDQQTGTLPGVADPDTGEWKSEFINKEGKWFNYIIGEETQWVNGEHPNIPWIGASGNLDTQEFSTQGIGMVIFPPAIMP